MIVSSYAHERREEEAIAAAKSYDEPDDLP